mmetsp:Transcript_2789/g.8016  ORF Transcript_2789/g.8016 Transcript_2789/m.8016 type:complete len:218 (+) Transcript_2789:410-1063(+)
MRSTSVSGPFFESHSRVVATSARMPALSSSVISVDIFSSPVSSYCLSITSVSSLWCAMARFLAAASSSAYFSASSDMRLMSFSESLTLPVTVICACVADVFSRADTLRIPSASTSKVTSIFASPFFMAGKPLSSNSPRSRLSFVRTRSPSNTLLVTATWSWKAVVYSLLLVMGMRVLRGMSLSITPPVVSMPRVRGAMSRRRRSDVVSSRTPARMAP